MPLGCRNPQRQTKREKGKKERKKEGFFYLLFLILSSCVREGIIGGISSISVASKAAPLWIQLNREGNKVAALDAIVSGF